MSMTRRELLGGGIGVTIGAASVLSASPAPVVAGPQSRVQMLFKGLCLATTKEITAQLYDLKVLLPDACNLPTIAGHIDEHTPLLCIPKTYVTGTYTTCRTDNTMWEWSLAGADITLMIDGAAPRDYVSAVSLPLGTDPAYGDDWRDIRWIANLKELQQATPKKVRKAYANDPPAGSIASRINLNGGTFGGAVPSTWDGRIAKWFFVGDDPLNRLKSRMMTDVARYDSPAGGALAIAITVRSVTTTIALKTPGDGSPIPAFVSNTAVMNSTCRTKTPFHHFRAYYDLLKDPPDFFPVPGHSVVARFESCIVYPDHPIYCPPPIAETEA